MAFVEQNKEKKITIHRTKEGVFHFDGDPAMGGKDLEVEVISKGLKVIAPQKTKSGVEAFNVLQHFTDFIGSRPITSAITRKHKELLQINHNLLRRLSKRN